MSMKTRVLHVGLGPIGKWVCERVVEEADLELVGAVDIDPELIGRSLSEVVATAPSGALIYGSAAAAIDALTPDVAVLTTVSELASVTPQAEEFLRRGVSVVSTCEEMAYPWHLAPELAERLDQAAKAGGAACLGCGINPGFVLDVLPAVVMAPLGRVTGLRATREVDASRRRGPLQRKVGAGLTPDEFALKVAGGGFGHRGMLESLHMLCDALGVSHVGAVDFIQPVISDRDVETPFVTVKAGQVAGIHQGASDPSGRVTLDLKMYVGAREPKDQVIVTGEPSLKVTVEGGYEGDRATAWITVNSVRAIRRATPGLKSMLDVLPASPRLRG